MFTIKTIQEFKENLSQFIDGDLQNSHYDIKEKSVSLGSLIQNEKVFA